MHNSDSVDLGSNPGSVVEAELDTGSDFTVVGADVVAGLNLQPSGPEIVLQAGVPGAEVRVIPYYANVQLVTGKQSR